MAKRKSCRECVLAAGLVCCVAQQEAKTKKKGKSKSKGMKASRSKGAVINTDKIGVLLDMIKGADVTSEENMAENDTLLELEGMGSGMLLEKDALPVFPTEECKKMRPVVEQNIVALQK